MLKAESFFEEQGELFSRLFAGTVHVWQALPRVGPVLDDILQPNVAALRQGLNQVKIDSVLYRGEVFTAGFSADRSGDCLKVYMEGELLKGASLVYAGAFLMDDEIYLGPGVVVEPAALICGPAMVGEGTQVRHGAYIRGQVILGKDCVIGHATEVKSAVLLGGSKAGHFAYIGDSILGRVNLGAGTKLANLKMNGHQVKLVVESQSYDTGLRKFGAIIGDGVETGCNSVTSPGTLLGKNSMLYPNAVARGFYLPGSIIRPPSGRGR